MDTNGNMARGLRFEELVGAFLNQNLGLKLEPNFSIPVGLGSSRKVRRFDLGSKDPLVLVECKAHTFTDSGNVPSAKISTWNEALLYFLGSPAEARKILFVQKPHRQKDRRSLGEYYLDRYNHLIPSDVELWEYEPSVGAGSRIH